MSPDDHILDFSGSQKRSELRYDDELFKGFQLWSDNDENEGWYLETI